MAGGASAGEVGLALLGIAREDILKSIAGAMAGRPGLHMNPSDNVGDL
jgi:hypothetical protein